MARLALRNAELSEGWFGRGPAKHGVPATSFTLIDPSDYFFSSLKTLLMPREPIRAPLGVNVPDFAMAGFQLTLYGRIWVTPEDSGLRGRGAGNQVPYFAFRVAHLHAQRESHVGHMECCFVQSLLFVHGFIEC